MGKGRKSQLDKKSEKSKNQDKKPRKSKTQAGIPENRYNLTELGQFIGYMTAREVGVLLRKNGLKSDTKATKLALDNGCAEEFAIDVPGLRFPVKPHYWNWETTRDYLLKTDDEFRYKQNELKIKHRLEQFTELMDVGNFEAANTLYSNIFEGISENDIPALKCVFNL